MSPFSNSVVIASAGDLSIAQGSTISLSVTWGSNISPFRWSRIWAAVESAGDSDSLQSVTILNEGSQWSLESPASTTLIATLRADGQSGVPIVAKIQVLTSTTDSF
jgi:hypothetical protein